MPPEYLQINGGKAGDLRLFFHCQQLQIRDSWCLTAVAEFFFQKCEVPMDADVEFEFGGVYRLGPKCCCMK